MGGGDGRDATAADAAEPEGASRIALTPAATELLRLLHGQHGALMFHQSGGCCDGSAPMCYPAGEFRTGAADVLLARLRVAGVPEPVDFWMSADQFARWRHTHLTVDVVPGRGSGFSLEAPEGVRFLIRSRLLTDGERARLGERSGPGGGKGPGAR
ncbi:DUF779 domain-containing protein [Streptomyces sp. NPDC048506]|uniref:DUF779 domain-containing protein n=1 Tax=Streptomyces sp. NPDC048506 TaxID=3155028 RepID=UPI003414A41F